MSYYGEVWKELEEELCARETRNHFKAIQVLRPELAAFPELETLFEFMWTRDKTQESAEAQDRTLQCLIRGYQDSPAPIWRLILLRLFWPMLIKEYARFRTSANFDEVWSDLMVAFHETLAHYPLDRRPGNIAANIKLDAMKRYVAMRKAESGREPILPEPVEIIDERPGPLDGLLMGADQELRERICQFVARTGCISRRDLRLIMATKVHGHKLGDLAQELDMTPDQVRMRRDRALERLRKKVREEFEKELFGF